MNDELITIKQYADMQGITTAAVYKKLTTGLKTYVINVPTVDNPQKSQIRLNYTAMQRDGLITVDRKPIKPTSTVDNPNITAEYIELLKSQLAQSNEQLRVKDEQINALQEQNTKLAQALENVTRIADQSQQLQAHTQKLLADKTEPKRGAFSWLFNKTPKAEKEYYTGDEPGQADTEPVTEPREI